MNDSEGEVQLVTLTEFIANERSLELEAAAKLPRKFDRCTYDRGYVRQPLFVCLTCRPSKADLDNEDTRTAVCYACSIACHASCDLIEIGARRAFRCDCGTSRFQGLCGSIKLGVRTCQLCPVKEKNIFNKYDGNGGHNFDGNFCKCSNSSVNFDTSIMHQCVVCEDWIHEECLGLVKMMGPFSDKEEGCIENFNENEFESIVDMEFDPKNSNFDQPSEEGVICECCIQKYPFLACIKQPDVDILNEESHESSICFCVPFKFQKGFVRLFPDWRKFICTCESCISKLESCNLAFLYTEDPLFEPEIDPDAQISSYDLGQRLLDERIPRHEVRAGIEAVFSLKEALKKFLEPFSTQNKIVTKEDIDAFVNTELASLRSRR